MTLRVTARVQPGKQFAVQRALNAAITSAVVTESVFSLPGLGKLIVNGAGNRDYTLVLGLVVLVTVIAVTFNLLVDLAYAALDPKIRY